MEPKLAHETKYMIRRIRRETKFTQSIHSSHKDEETNLKVEEQP